MLCKYGMLSPNCFVMEKEESERNVRRHFYPQQQQGQQLQMQQGQQQGQQHGQQQQQQQQQQQIHQPTNKNIMHFNESILIRTAMTLVAVAMMASIAVGDSGLAQGSCGGADRLVDHDRAANATSALSEIGCSDGRLDSNSRCSLCLPRPGSRARQSNNHRRFHQM